MPRARGRGEHHHASVGTRHKQPCERGCAARLRRRALPAGSSVRALLLIHEFQLAVAAVNGAGKYVGAVGGD